jgi:hypothetical protein
MKIFGAVAIILDAVFMIWIGDKDKTFKTNNPWLFKNLVMFGLRVPRHLDGKSLNIKEINGMLKSKLYFNAAYLIMSILMRNYFVGLKAAIKCEENWTNEDFEKLYTYVPLKEKTNRK